ncbi:hypothetical protein JTB14_017881 [Gonioctena quinquepunctata]|nr:hypothetical protein JTB14_017881 [Gonioctena quinquepunctata]
MLKKLENQEAQIYTLIEKQEKCDQYHKSRNIIVYGVSEEHNENCRSILLDIFKNKMELHIDHVNIENCHRMKSRNVNQPKPIFVRFTTNHYKNEVYQNKKSPKNTGILIREDLTNQQRQILMAVIRRLGKDGKVWTNHGTIFSKINEGANVFKINSSGDLDRLFN